MSWRLRIWLGVLALAGCAATATGPVYRRDLPILITTDSILRALHRSSDKILIEPETRAT